MDKTDKTTVSDLLKEISKLRTENETLRQQNLELKQTQGDAFLADLIKKYCNKWHTPGTISVTDFDVFLCQDIDIAKNKMYLLKGKRIVLKTNDALEVRMTTPFEVLADERDLQTVHILTEDELQFVKRTVQKQSLAMVSMIDESLSKL